MKFIGDLFRKITWKLPSPLNAGKVMSLVIPPQAVDQSVSELDFNDLKDNFSKRTCGSEAYHKILFKTNPRLCHWIGSIDYSGHVRERSLTYLIENYVAGDENRILLRLEDWVPQVREIAERWTRHNLSALSLPQLNDNYRLILYLSRKVKLQNDSILKFIDQCLIEKTRSIDQSQFFQLHPHFRRHLYQLALSDNPILRSWVLTDKDRFNRLELLKFLTPNALTPDEVACFHQDRSVFVRRYFLYYLIRYQITPPKEVLIKSCFDSNPGLRDLGRFYLSKYYELDAYALYKSQKGKELYYIADYAKKADWDFFVEGFGSSKADIRYLCLKAICKIDYRYLSQLSIPELLTSQKKVRQLVCGYLPKILSVEQIVQLRDVFEKNLSNGFLIYLNVLYRKSFWHFLDESLSILIAGNSELALQLIRRRFHQKTYTYEQLSPAIAKSLKDKICLLAQSSDRTILKLIKEMEFLIQTT